MNYGLYLSASGVLTNMYRQDVFANNLANVETFGFRPDRPEVLQRAPASAGNELGFDLSHDLLDRLGGGAHAGPQSIDFSQGSLRSTGQPLDAALTDAHEFFVVEVRDLAGGTRIGLTRDGRFSRNAQGELVTQAGHRVLGPGDQPIRLPEGPATLDGRGQLMLDGQVLGQLQITHVAGGAGLEKRGQNLLGFKVGAGDRRQAVTTPVLKAGFVEASGTNPIAAMVAMTSAAKAATSNARLIEYHDRLMDQAVNTLGRISG